MGGIEVAGASAGAEVLKFGGMPMMWTRLSPAVETKKMLLSGLKAPASGAVGGVADALSANVI